MRIPKQHKESIKKLIISNDIGNWTLALNILLGFINRNNTESMIIQYILNNYSGKCDYNFYPEIEEWIKENITNIKLRNNFYKKFVVVGVPGGPGLRSQLSQGSVRQHSDQLTLNELNDWFNIILTERKKPQLTMIVNKTWLEEFDKAIKEEI